MNFLLVNDDGIDSPLLLTLCRACAARGHRVTVCAPAAQQSAKSHSFTVFQPLQVRKASMEGALGAYAVSGTPVDCVRLGLLALDGGPYDLVISGINNGYNAGLATYVSGTVGAAREAAFQRMPALAVSAHPRTPEETVRFFAKWAVRLGEHLTEFAIPAQSVCNVNVPPVEISGLKEPLMCPINRGIYKDGYEKRVSPRGDTYFWLTPETPDDHPDPGSDMDALNRGHVSCTFLTPDPCRQPACDTFLSTMA